MNLKEFLDYRRACPICNNNLTVSFHSNRRQLIRLENNKMVVIFRLEPLRRKHIVYQIGYCFDIESQSFSIEFYTQDHIRFEKDVPLFLLDRFRELDKNLKSYRIHKNCMMCRRYHYSSGKLIFDYKNCLVSGMEIELERIGLSQLTTNGYRIYRLDSFPKDSETHLNCWVSDHEEEAIINYGCPWYAQKFSLPLIPFVSKEETTERLKTLLTFS